MTEPFLHTPAKVHISCWTLTDMHTKYTSVGYCVYCGSRESPLSDEHIIPFALNGIWTLPESSCLKCADITKKFEQSVARTMYGIFRIKRGFQTRRKKERPQTLPLYTVALDGTLTTIDTLVQDYPNLFLAVDAPPPGILEGNEPTDQNPALKVSLKGDPREIGKVMKAMSLEQMLTKHQFKWGDFFRQLAKIGHCYAYACTHGRDYQPLLPDIILGKSNCLSYYVGGSDPTSSEVAPKSTLSLSIVCKPSGDYLVVGVQLLGIGTLHPYQVVVGRIPNLDAFINSMTEARSS